MRVQISTFKHYGAWYPQKSSGKHHAWWYCLTDGAVMSLDELLQSFGYGSEEEILESAAFLPIFQTSIPALEREFLEDLHLQKVIKQLNQAADFDIAFRIYVERDSLLFDRWRRFEGEHLRAGAVQWCRENGVAFVDDGA